MFVSEAMFYGQTPWPHSFVGMTVARWKQVYIVVTALW